MPVRNVLELFERQDMTPTQHFRTRSSVGVLTLQDGKEVLNVSNVAYAMVSLPILAFPGERELEQAVTHGLILACQHRQDEIASWEHLAQRMTDPPFFVRRGEFRALCHPKTKMQIDYCQGLNKPFLVTRSLGIDVSVSPLVPDETLILMNREPIGTIYSSPLGNLEQHRGWIRASVIYDMSRMGMLKIHHEPYRWKSWWELVAADDKDDDWEPPKKFGVGTTSWERILK